MIENIGFVRLTETAKLPTRGSNLSSGFDFYADNFKVVYQGNTSEHPTPIVTEISLGTLDRILVGTGLAINLGYNEELQIRPRSGLALKEGITVLNTPGTIDEDYKNEIGVILINTSTDVVTIKLGERIAQGVIMDIKRKEPCWHEILVGNDREGGFGSTGK